MILRSTPHFLQHPTQTVASLLCISALAFGLTACGKNEEASVGQRLDTAVAKTEQAAAEAKAKADAAVANAGAKIEQGAATAESAVKDATNQAAAAIDDASITAQVSAGLVKDPDLSALKINVDTVKGVVTLNGTTTNDAARQRAEAIAKDVKGVASVNNRLTVSPG
jgi:hyperosmotically inducible protein